MLGTSMHIDCDHKSNRALGWFLITLPAHCFTRCLDGYIMVCDTCINEFIIISRALPLG